MLYLNIAAEPIIESDLRGWKLIANFQNRLAAAAKSLGRLSPTWTDPKRLLSYDTYLSLFLVGLLNPVVRTMRGLCAASNLQRIQEEVCRRPVSLGSFSEAQNVLDPALLAKVFEDLSQEVSQKNPTMPAGQGQRCWKIQDSSLFEALPRMFWTFWRKQRTDQFQVRLHLSLDLNSKSPARLAITPGKGCERAAWRKLFKKGDAYLGDCYFGEDYKLFFQLDETGVAFVVRVRDEAVINIEEELPVSAADRQHGVLRTAWVRLGHRPSCQSMRLRLVWVQTPEKVIRLVTNITPEELSAGDVALLYKRRWQIELFFRWIKCVLGCRHWLAQSPEGVAVQIYLALIAALLLQLYTGDRPNRRLMELIQFYLMGVARWEELWKAVEQDQARRAKIKKR